MSDRFVCVLTRRYISMHILSLCAVLCDRLLHCMLSLRFVNGLIKTLFVCLFCIRICQIHYFSDLHNKGGHGMLPSLQRNTVINSQCAHIVTDCGITVVRLIVRVVCVCVCVCACVCDGNVHRVRRKKCHYILPLLIRQMPTDFQNSFTDRLSRIFSA